MKNTDKLARLADEAYGAGLTATSDEQRAYARGVEDVTRWLLGREPVPPALAELLVTANRKRQMPRG